MATTSEKAAVTIATERLPEKNDSASGSLVSLKRL